MLQHTQSTKRYFLELSYKGTKYHGWQTQKNAVAIQDVIQDALYQLLQCDTPIVGSSRTDAGVHAKMQFAHVDLPASLLPDRLVRRLNAVMPSDIVVHRILPVQPTAHARFDAERRGYVYYILRSRSAFCLETHWCVEQRLDLNAMRCAADKLVGRKNFEKLSKRGSDVAHHWCNVDHAEWIDRGDVWMFYIRANRFLRGMVRCIVGGLWQVGTGRLSLQTWQTFLDASCTLTPKLAPAHGLFLAQVHYPARIFVHARPSDPICFQKDPFQYAADPYKASDNIF